MPSVQTPKTQPCAIPSSLTAPAGRYHTIQKMHCRSCQSEKQTGKLGQRLTGGPASTPGSQTPDRQLTHRPLPLSQCPSIHTLFLITSPFLITVSNPTSGEGLPAGPEVTPTARTPSYRDKKTKEETDTKEQNTHPTNSEIST